MAGSARPFEPWTKEVSGDCDRYGLTMGITCRGACKKKYWAKLACKKSDCPVCYHEVSSRRGARFLARAGGVETFILVVTFDRTYRSRLQGDMLTELQRALWRTVESWFEANLKGRIGGRLAWHPCGDECSRCGAKSKAGGLLGKCETCGKEAAYKPHLNMLIPACLVKSDGTVKRKHLYLSDDQRVALRAVLRRTADAFAIAAGLEPRPVNVWHEYRKAGTRAQRHAARYFLRSFPAWNVHVPRQVDMGLLAGQGRLQEIYREAVKAPAEPQERPKCPCCDGILSFRPLQRREGGDWRIDYMQLQGAAAGLSGMGDDDDMPR